MKSPAISSINVKGTTALDQLARWACGLRLEQVPERVRQQAINQILSTLAAVYSGWDSDVGSLLEKALPPPGSGPARIVPTGVAAPASHAALLMASWSMVLDFDDVMLGGHTGHSSVLVPLAIGSGAGCSGEQLLLAQIVANEVAARINMVCGIGSTRGQMAAHLHLLAAAAARAKLEQLDEANFAGALSFALSYPSRALFPAFLGSDAKVLCASLPVRVGMEAVDMVRAGLIAAAEPLNGPDGFFAMASRVPVREFLDGLGERWHTETNSFKIYPVCGYLCSVLDATLDLVRAHDISAADVSAVDVWASLFTVRMDAHSKPYLDGPRSRISTLTFSTPFVVASAILAREFSPDQLRRSWIEDRRVWELAERVRTHHDVQLTIRAITADIPIGAGLRRASRWQAAGFAWSAAAAAYGRLGRWRSPAALRLVAASIAAAGDRRPLDFQRSTKPLGARLEIRLRDGRRFQKSVSIPRGFAGAPLAEANGQNVRDLMREKFLAAAGNVIGSGPATEVARMIEGLETLPPGCLPRLLQLACLPPKPDKSLKSAESDILLSLAALPVSSPNDREQA